VEFKEALLAFKYFYWADKKLHSINYKENKEDIKEDLLSDFLGDKSLIDKQDAYWNKNKK